MPIAKSRNTRDGDGELVWLSEDVISVCSGDVLTIHPKPGQDEIEVRDAGIIPERPGL
jgi:hypothetical protein